MATDKNPQIYYLEHYSALVHYLTLACIDVLLRHLGQWLNSEEIMRNFRDDELVDRLNEVLQDEQGGFSQPESFVGSCCAYASGHITAVQHEESANPREDNKLQNMFCI